MTDIATTASPARSIVFIDARVQDAATLLQGLKPGTEVVFLQAGQDGLAQMAAALGERGDVGAVHVLTHGSAGQMWLGNAVLDEAALARPEVQAALATLGQGLTANADILLYACELARGDAGAAFITQWATLTQADVAGSTNLTGAAHLGGDWVLERQVGEIGTAPLSLNGYAHLLVTPSDQGFNGETPRYLTNAGETIGNAIYSMVAPTSGDGAVVALNQVGASVSITSSSDYAVMFNYEGLSVVPGAVDARITSVDGSEFRIVSMEVDTGNGLGTTSTLTVWGYRDGVAVASDSINTGVSDATGSVSYAKNGVPGGFGGVLTFNSDWNYIDEIRFTGNNTIVVVDDLDFEPGIAPDATPPTVTSVTSGTPNGTYKVGDVISIQVNFSENVVVAGGTPQLILETGVTDRTINYVSGTGTSTLTFTYTVQAGDTTADLDYVATTSLALGGGTIRDSAGNYATLTLPSPGTANSLGNNQAIVIDGVLPVVASITRVSAALTNGTSVQ